MSLTDAVRNNVIDALNGVAAFVPVTAPLKIRLMTANGTGAANGAELATGAGGGTGAGYTAGGKAITFAPAAGGAANPTADIRWDNMPAATIVGAELWDSSAVPRRIQFAPLTTPRTVAAGDSFELPLADVDETLS